MAACFTEWTVLPHDPIQKLTENFWCVQGVMPDGKTTRKMSVVRLRDGSLLFHNAIALKEEAMQELEAFGRPAYIVVPGAFHRQDARIWKDRFPGAKVVAPAGAKKKIDEIAKVDLDYRDAPGDDTVKLAYFDGCKEKEGYVEIRSESGTTLVINDVVCNLPKLGGFIGFFMGPTGQASVPRITRWMIVKERNAVGEHLDRLAQIADLRRVVLSHGENLEHNPNAALRAARATA
ncbi:MAG TPA: hypothetical protein VMI54_24045 [Polyangiaceae bacterium]|nr:hypothetical protein [Polyangiaceae bacterium]